MSLCIGLGCGVEVPEGVLSCTGHHGLEVAAPSCPDGHGDLAFVLVSAVRLGGTLSLLWACPCCDYVTTTDYPPALSPDAAPPEQLVRLDDGPDGPGLYVLTARVHWHSHSDPSP